MWNFSHGIYDSFSTSVDKKTKNLERTAYDVVYTQRVVAFQSNTREGLRRRSITIRCSPECLWIILILHVPPHLRIVQPFLATVHYCLSFLKYM